MNDILIQHTPKPGIACLTLNNTAKANALDTALCYALTNAIKTLNQDSTTKVIILKANGRIFSAGGDIKAMSEQRDMFTGDAAAIAQHYQDIIHPLQQTIQRSSIPLIAAVDGTATGAGNDLVANCDIVLATPTSRFCESFVNIGLISGDGGLWILPRRVGQANARMMALTGEWVNAERAQQIGLVNEIVDASQLEARSLAIATQIAKHSLAAIRGTRDCLQHAQQHDFDQHLAFCAQLQGELHHTPEHREKLATLLNQIEQRRSTP